MKTKTGRASVYVCYSYGFDGDLRPCYDSAPLAKALMTEAEVSTLRSMIAKYMKKCADRRGVASMPR